MTAKTLYYLQVLLTDTLTHEHPGKITKHRRLQSSLHLGARHIREHAAGAGAGRAPSHPNIPGLAPVSTPRVPDLETRVVVADNKDGMVQVRCLAARHDAARVLFPGCVAGSDCRNNGLRLERFNEAGFVAIFEVLVAGDAGLALGAARTTRR